MHFLVGILIVWLLVKLGWAKWIALGVVVLLIVLVVWDAVVNEIPSERLRQQEQASSMEWCKHPTHEQFPGMTEGGVIDRYLRSTCPKDQGGK